MHLSLLIFPLFKIVKSLMKVNLMSQILKLFEPLEPEKHNLVPKPEMLHQFLNYFPLHFHIVSETTVKQKSIYKHHRG